MFLSADRDLRVYVSSWVSLPWPNTGAGGQALELRGSLLCSYPLGTALAVGGSVNTG